MGIVTLDAAKRHLKPPGSIDDTRIEEIIEQATAIVLEHIKLPTDAYQSSAGDPTSEVPKNVAAATLLVIGALYDNADGQDPDKNPLSPAVLALLHGKRKPTLA